MDPSFSVTVTKCLSEAIQVGGRGGSVVVHSLQGVVASDSWEGMVSPALPFSALTVGDAEGSRQEVKLACDFHALLPWLDVFHPRPHV